MEKMNSNLKILVLMLSSLALIHEAQALSVVSDYLENDTMHIAEGNYTIYGIRLQNPAREGIFIMLSYDKSSIRVIDYKETYYVEPQSSLPILLNISAGENKPGAKFDIGYTIHQVSGSGEGVPVLLKINKVLRVNVIRNADKFYFEAKHLYYAVGSLVLTFALYKAGKILANKPKNKNIKSKSRKLK